VRDEQLIAAIRTGDATARELLARRYYADLYAYFCSRIGRDDAEDLTQVTLLHTVARVERFREESTFRHYVFSVARRVFFDRHRRAQRRLDTEEPRSEPPASQTTPSERMFRAEFREQLIDAIASLHDHYRVVVDLYLRGKDNFEIAQALDLEYNTVRSRLSRGLSSVRQQLAPWVGEHRSGPLAAASARFNGPA
jgi:RNA polymerase sigma-70 factor (ECF subfamily)